MTPLFASEYRGADRNLAIAIWEDIQPCSDLQLYRNKKFQPHTHRDRLLPLASQLFSPCSIQADRLVCYHMFSFFLPRNFFFQADMRFYISMRDCWIRPQETCLRNLKHYSTSEPPRIIQEMIYTGPKTRVGHPFFSKERSVHSVLFRSL